MRSFFFVAALLAALGIALPAAAERFILNPGSVTKVPTCTSGGGSSVTVQPGSYILTVNTGDIALCYAATCATGGATLVAGTQIRVYFNGPQAVSCRSDQAGAAEFLKADLG